MPFLEGLKFSSSEKKRKISTRKAALCSDTCHIARLPVAIVSENSIALGFIGALRKAPPFHGTRSSREIKFQNASCQMGDREVTR